MENDVLLIIIGVCSFIFTAGFTTKRNNFPVRLVGRGISTGLLIWTVNMVLNLFSVNGPVGVNVLTLAFGTVLGLPGIVTLYAVGIYGRL